MDVRSAAVVWNPQSQNGELGQKWPHLSKVLRRELGAFEAMRTRGPGDATRLTREALGAGADLVVAVGGDGTLHEVANGFFDDEQRAVAPDAALGLLPYGTGGDFRKTIEMPRGIEAAAKALRWGTPRSIDMGCLDYTRTPADGGGKGHCLFVNIASFGISGVVDRLVNARSKRWGGKLSFFLGAVQAGLTYDNQPVKMYFDGDEDDHLSVTINSVVVANGRYFGGGMHVAPEAELDDGWFDVVTTHDMGKLEYFMQGPRVYSGTHLQAPKVGFRRARQLDARPANPDEQVLLDVDGETPGMLPARFRVLPAALKVVMPS